MPNQKTLRQIRTNRAALVALGDQQLAVESRPIVAQFFGKGGGVGAKDVELGEDVGLAQVVGGEDDGAALLGLFALAYQLYGGLKAVALTDIVQVTLLVMGGLLVTGITLSHIGGGSIAGGFTQLWNAHPEHFEMILSKDNPFYKDLPGISVLIGGMWIMNISYWGFNQYIIQRALAAKDIREAQKGIYAAALLKTPDGLPLGVQFVGPPAGEGRLFATNASIDAMAPLMRERFGADGLTELIDRDDIGAKAGAKYRHRSEAEL